ncbi:MAG: CUB domain-containing protein [Bacteroidales bacterium]
MKKKHLNIKQFIFLCSILIINSISMEHFKLYGQSCVNETYTNLTGSISDGSGDNLYDNNLNCEKLISVPAGYTIALTFSYFHTEDSYDFVKIYDGSTASSPLLGSFSGDAEDYPPPVTSSANQMLIVFTTDGSVTRGGWDASYEAQGGTTPPQPPSSLWQQNGNNIYYDYNNGNVGIGTATPSAYLHVSKSLNTSAEVRGEKIDLTNSGSGHVYGMDLNVENTYGMGDAYGLKTVANNSYDGISYGGYFNAENNVGNAYSVFAITSSNYARAIYGKATGQSSYAGYFEGNGYFSGNVGIGTTNFGDGKLAVNGKILATEVEVKVFPWSDYVFTKDYKLRTIEEVADFISENGHLPEVPSAKEVEENGLKLGEMNAILLKKIEELTLYIIDLEKRFQELENKK